MKMLKHAWLASVLLVFACAKSTTPEQGTNTNWLRTCDEEADCDADDACLCGVCTKPCSEDDQCSAVHEATRCEALDESTCGASSASMSACLQGCDSNADCTALQDGRCVSGLCVPEASMPTRDASTDATVPKPDSDASANPLALGRDGNVVAITDVYTACTGHNECVLVSTSCDGCCGQGAIAEGMQDAYDANFSIACEGIENNGCPCDPALMIPACRDAHCIALDALDECYSPTQNLDLAYVPGAQGCECQPRDTASTTTSICLGREALICTPLPLGQAWIAVEDGPCGEPEPDPTCADGEVRPTPTACIEEFELCYVLPNGEYCGRNP